MRTARRRLRTPKAKSTERLTGPGGEAILALHAAILGGVATRPEKPMPRRTFVLSCAAALVALALAGCGNKGQLVLPDQAGKTQGVPAAGTNADQRPPAPADAPPPDGGH
jgi:predicted small lipoprotein YifL